VLINQAGYYGIHHHIAEERAKKFLSILQLTHKLNEPSVRLSGGMKRRLMIARAMMHDPQVIFLDEPTAGIDIEIRAIIWEFLKELQRNGKTIILTTHYLEEAEALDGNMTELLSTVDYTHLAVTIEQNIDKKHLTKFGKHIKQNGKNTLEITINKDELSLNIILNEIISSGLKITNIRNLKSGLETFL
jgi:ABC-2 type transport system ATP-binding protein